MTLESHASYRFLSPYAPFRPPSPIDLSDNTNLWGMPPSALEALRGLTPAALTRYPSVYAGELKEALAEHLGVRPENITTGCGSDDIIDSALRAFCGASQRLAYAEPTFVMMPIFAHMNGLVPAPVALKEDFELDVDAVLAARARVAYVCNPNNPTGSVVSSRALERLAQDFDGLVLLDEAYAEYAGGDLTALVLRSERVLSVRTLSKAYGLAGLRVGYAVGSAAVIAEVEKSRGPYKVSVSALAASVAAVRGGRGWVQERVVECRANRERFRAELSALGARPLPSAANFVLLPVVDSAAAARALHARGISARPFAKLSGIGDALRVTIGPWEMLEPTLEALAELAPWK